MSKTLVVVLGILLVVVLGVVGVMNMYSSTFDTAVNFEEDIKGRYDQSENSLSTYTLKIKEKTQISDMYVKDLRSVIESYFSGKQGVNETQVMSFIQQHIPNLDPAIYKELLATIEAGREKFSNDQKIKIQQCASYKKFLRSYWNAKILAGSEFPSKDISHYCVVVSDQQTRNAMSTGIQEPLKLN